MLACRGEPDGVPSFFENVSARRLMSEVQPRILFATLTPRWPAPGETLVLRYGAEDPQGGALSVGILWRWNGRQLDAEGLALRVPDEARRGDTIKARILVQNEIETSERVWREVSVGNTREEWISLKLMPEGEVAPGTVLTAVSEVKDHDGDLIEYQYTWMLNGERHRTAVATFSTVGLRRDDEITVTVNASDGETFGTDRTSNSVKILNSDPTITSTPPEFSQDGSLRYAVEAKDADGDRRFVFSLNTGPESAQIDRLTGVLTWTPTEEDIGTHMIEVRVADRYDGHALQRFELTVGLTPQDPLPASRE